MENYKKGESRKVFDPPCQYVEGAVEMKVTSGSKVRNLMGFALSSMGDKNVRHIVWNGTGNAISKTITCAEILKRKTKCLHQVTQIGVMRVEDLWEPVVEGLDTLKVNTNVPTISILLSKDPLDTSNPSYQAPGATNMHWAGSSKRQHHQRSGKNSAAVNELKNALSKPKRSRGNKKEGKNSGAKTPKEQPAQAKQTGQS